MTANFMNNIDYSNGRWFRWNLERIGFVHFGGITGTMGDSKDHFLLPLDNGNIDLYKLEYYESANPYFSNQIDTYARYKRLETLFNIPVIQNHNSASGGYGEYNARHKFFVNRYLANSEGTEIKTSVIVTLIDNRVVTYYTQDANWS